MPFLATVTLILGLGFLVIDHAEETATLNLVMRRQGRL
jgi:hypothetical protein